MFWERETIHEMSNSILQVQCFLLNKAYTAYKHEKSQNQLVPEF